MPHSLRFEDMVTRSIAAEQIAFRLTVFKPSIAAGPNRLESTIFKAQFQRIAISKLVSLSFMYVCVYVCVCVHVSVRVRVTQGVSLAQHGVGADQILVNFDC